MKRWLICALLAGCTAAPIPDVAGYRDTSAPFAATTRGDAARISGTWHVRAGFGATQARTVSVSADAGRVVVDGRAGTLIWADTDYRTLAVGDRAGRFGMILDREPSGGADRHAAAREMFAWFGYNMTKLEVAK